MLRMDSPMHDTMLSSCQPVMAAEIPPAVDLVKMCVAVGLIRRRTKRVVCWLCMWGAGALVLRNSESDRGANSVKNLLLSTKLTAIQERRASALAHAFSYLQRLLAFIALSRFVLAGAQSQDAPIPPLEAPGRMTLPDGFHVTLFASEPDVRQPIAFTFDDRGRLWVAECYSYPDWKTEGHDRILILEDEDGDGRFDRRTVFWDKGANISGLEFGFGGIWV